MDPVRDELLASLRGIQPRPATLPMFSTVTGRRIDGPEMGAEYWWRQRPANRPLRRWRRSAHRDGLRYRCRIESASGADGGASANAIGTRQESSCGLPRCAAARTNAPRMLRSLGLLYTLGQPIDWSGVLSRPARIVRLPRYPWQRERCWFESEESRVTRLQRRFIRCWAVARRSATRLGDAAGFAAVSLS